MSIEKEIEAKIKKVKIIIEESYPNHCRKCNGRGGSVIEWHGCPDFSPCGDCVKKGIDPLNVNLKLLPPTDYGLYHYEDGEMWEAWFELDHLPGHWRSPTLNRDLQREGWTDAWSDTPMGELSELQEILRDLQEVYSRFKNLEANI